MKNPFENDRKHQNELQHKKDAIFYLNIILVISAFLCMVGVVINAIRDYSK